MKTYTIEELNKAIFDACNKTLYKANESHERTLQSIEKELVIEFQKTNSDIPTFKRVANVFAKYKSQSREELTTGNDVNSLDGLNNNSAYSQSSQDTSLQKMQHALNKIALGNEIVNNLEMMKYCNDYPHDRRCEGVHCYCASRAKKENRCEACNGFGKVPDRVQPEFVSSICCKKCKGTGKKEVELKTSKEWMKEFPQYIILDPDGWDRTNYKYSFDEEKISRKQFEDRLSHSTVRRTQNESKN